MFGIFYHRLSRPNNKLINKLYKTFNVKNTAGIHLIDKVNVKIEIDKNFIQVKNLFCAIVSSLTVGYINCLQTIIDTSIHQLAATNNFAYGKETKIYFTVLTPDRLVRTKEDWEKLKEYKEKVLKDKKVDVIFCCLDWDESFNLLSIEKNKIDIVYIVNMDMIKVRPIVDKDYLLTNDESKLSLERTRTSLRIRQQLKIKMGRPNCYEIYKEDNLTKYKTRTVNKVFYEKCLTIKRELFFLKERININFKKLYTLLIKELFEKKFLTEVEYKKLNYSCIRKLKLDNIKNKKRFIINDDEDNKFITSMLKDCYNTKYYKVNYNSLEITKKINKSKFFNHLDFSFPSNFTAVSVGENIQTIVEKTLENFNKFKLSTWYLKQLFKVLADNNIIHKVNVELKFFTKYNLNKEYKNLYVGYKEHEDYILLYTNEKKEDFVLRLKEITYSKIYKVSKKLICNTLVLKV